MKLKPMRNFASGKTHLVNLADEHLTWFKWIGPEFLGTATPYITICGATIRPGRHAAVWMQNGEICRMCERFAPRGSVVAFYEPALVPQESKPE